jgi:hypothetical protein
MGVVLAFTLMAIGSNAVYLNYTKKSRSYTSTSSADLTGNPEVLASSIEWKVNSGTQHQYRVGRGNIERSMIETGDELSNVFTPYGITYDIGNITNRTISRHSDDGHLVDINLTITVDDGVNRMLTPYSLTIVHMISDPWPSAEEFNSVVGTRVTFDYRLPVAVYSGDLERNNSVIRVSADFSSELDRLGLGGNGIDPSSITVAEHNPDRNTLPILMTVHPHAYIGDESSGEIIWISDGYLPPDSYRWFYIYFDLYTTVKPDITPPGNLVVTDDGWVSNSLFSAELLNGSYLRIGGTPDIGTGSPSWAFRFNSGPATIGGWDSWTLMYNSSVYAVVRTQKGGLIRTWKFYSSSTLIEIEDSWALGGGLSTASFRTEDEMSYMGAAAYSTKPRKQIGGDPENVITGSESTELPLPNETWAGDLATVMHYDNQWTFYAYIYELDMAADVDWAVNPGNDYKRMILWQDNTLETTHHYYMYMFYDSSSIGSYGAFNILDEVESLADPPEIRTFHAHRY